MIVITSVSVKTSESSGSDHINFNKFHQEAQLCQ